MDTTPTKSIKILHFQPSNQIAHFQCYTRIPVTNFNPMLEPINVDSNQSDIPQMLGLEYNLASTSTYQIYVEGNETRSKIFKDTISKCPILPESSLNWNVT